MECKPQTTTTFNAWKDAIELQTNDTAIIQILTKRNHTQRLQIASHFTTMFKKDLTQKLVRELPGKIKHMAIALMTPQEEYQALEFYEAVQGTDIVNIDTVIEILGAHSNKEIRRMRLVYAEKYSSRFLPALTDPLKWLFVRLAEGDRDETATTDKEQAKREAKCLKRALKLWSQTTHSQTQRAFGSLLCQRSAVQLRLILEEYKQLTGEEFEDTSRKEVCDPTIRRVLLSVLYCLKDEVGYLATRLWESMEQQDYRTLIRIVVSRSEKDLDDIKAAFEAKYDKTLSRSIQDETPEVLQVWLLPFVG